jgi:integrase
MAGHRRGGGTVFRPKGRTIWRYSYFVNGRRITESSGSTDEAEAHRQLQVKLGEKASGKAVPPSRATIGDLCALVMDNHRMRELRRTKVVEYVLKAHILKALGRLPASRFGSFQIKAYIQQRQAEGASNATVNRELAIVGRAFKLGYEAEPKLVFQLPVIHKLPESNPRQGFLEPDQYETLLGELPANLKALFVCGYHTGARKGELRSIQWPQVDFAAGLIRLPADQTKNKHPRTLPIYGDMRRWLEHQCETCPKGCLWVFHGSPSGQIDTHLNGWPEACKRAGVPDLLFHDLRRSAVRNMKKAGLQDLEAMRISGHLTRNVFDRYNIIDEEDLAAAGKRLEEYAQKRKQERAARLRLVK